ncbi:MAG TPA: helix-turn-helix transcriptional regulator [Candidatus Galloscillospira excrementavium]|nr:helix-turn-helix transcriptional regulator [Candidatus Galloscillospira excrementavium]
MTSGQRIAQKRKELGLSQEALGEELGVSRQAIYKWESDASLPEIEKLVALSARFSVSVGWLLGVEETPGGPAEAAGANGELTGAQLKMVEEIVDRYLAAQPPAPAQKRRRWPRVLLALAGVVILGVFINLFSRLDRVTEDYNSLQNSIGSLTYDVNSQIGSITSRVEEILKSQNTLTAEYHTSHLSSDPAANTATFAVYAVPKTYVEGMEALFLADCEEDAPLEFPGTLGEAQSFSAEITVPLTDSIALSVVFVTGEKRETQVLDYYGSLYSETFPSLTLETGPLEWEVEDGVLPAHSETGDRPVLLREYGSGDCPYDPDRSQIQVGLFRDNELVLWYEERPYTYILDGKSVTTSAWYRPRDVVLEPGHEYAEALVYTDQYGRQRVYPDGPIVYDEASGEWSSPGSYALINDPAAWTF